MSCTATLSSEIDIYSGRPMTIHTQPLTPIILHQQQQRQQQQISRHKQRPSRVDSVSSSASSSSDDLSLHHQRPLTPPTPISIYPDDNKQLYFSSKQDEYLRIIEPNPVYPPEYQSLAPGGCPRFPVSSSLGPNIATTNFDDFFAPISFSSKSCSPPAYSPSVYKIGVIARKLEYINPYEVSANRLWKYQIAEINSTQVNFYAIPTIFENQLVQFKASILQQMPTKETKRLNSSFTDQHDLQLYTLIKLLGIFKNRLIRSYSLQHAKVGLASDYKKRENVLRVRLENEQMLLAFETTQALIDWNLALNVGKDISLDVDERELPKYRTIPRRRRRRNQESSSSSSASSIVTRLRSSSDPFRGKFSKLKSKLSRASKKDTPIVPPYINQITRSHSNPNLPLPSQIIEEEGEYEEDGEFDTIDEQQDDGQEDIQDMSELHQSDDEEEEDVDDGETSDDYDHSAVSPHYPLSFSSDSDYKWSPAPDKTPSKKRYYKQCLRCIRALNMDDSWLEKSLVMATSTQQLVSAGTSELTKMRRRVSIELERIPNHYLRVYNVGTNGLVPI